MLVCSVQKLHLLSSILRVRKSVRQSFIRISSFSFLIPTHHSPKNTRFCDMQALFDGFEIASVSIFTVELLLRVWSAPAAEKINEKIAASVSSERFPNPTDEVVPAWRWRLRYLCSLYGIVGIVHSTYDREETQKKSPKEKLLPFCLSFIFALPPCSWFTISCGLTPRCGGRAAVLDRSSAGPLLMGLDNCRPCFPSRKAAQGTASRRGATYSTPGQEIYLV
jgi:hypothetical protein